MSERLWISTRKGLFRVQRSASDGWHVAAGHFLGDRLSLTLADPRDGALYAALDHGHFGVKLHRSDDDAESWSEIATPQYPEKPEDVVDEDQWGRPIEWSTSLIWALEPGRPDQPGRLWCGTIPGGLFVSNDRGESWSLIRSLWDHPKRRLWFGGGADQAGLHSICVDPRDGARVTVGVSCGGVWQTEDGGQTWACRADGMRANYMPPERADEPYIQDPHHLAQCPAAPEVMWAQHHNGVFRTTDNARSWVEIADIEPSNFGFAVAVHPHDPDTAWLVPAVSDEHRIPVEGRVAVTRTRDGGQTFEVLRSGLPQEHAYDLTFRHALDVDETGTRLAFGTTTGSLWVSEDQGDTWETISNHLPPIYAVRFG